MVALREPPTPSTSPTGTAGEGEYADEVAAQTRALWASSAMMLQSVAGVDDITATVTPTLDTPIAAGMAFWFVPVSDNLSNMTLEIDGQGQVPLLNADGSLLVEGDVLTGRVYLIICTQADELRLVNKDTANTGSAIGAQFQTFAADGTWIKPSSGSVALVRLWGPGGSGGRGGAADGGGGGGGGGYVEKLFSLSSLPSTVDVVIGQGGAAVSVDNTNGNPGSAPSTFGSFLTAYPGGGGNGNAANSGGGGGGGALGAGSTATGVDGGDGGLPRGSLATTSTGGAAVGFFGIGGDTGVAGANGDDGGGGGGGGAAATAAAGGNSSNGGGGGGNGVDTGTAGDGGSSINGGGGGGGGSGTATGGNGGTSINGGNGGAGSTGSTAATAGSAPGGGGGGSETANSGAGANGRCEVLVW